MEHQVSKPEGRKIGWECTCGKRFTTEVQAEAHIMDLAEKLFNGEIIVEEAPEEKKEVTKAAPKKALSGAPAISAYLNKDEIKAFIEKRINSNPGPFISSIMTAVNGSPRLAESTPQSILGAAIEASVLNLSVNPNLGQAHLVPYKNNKKGVYEAQLQLGWKGYIQLAQRSGLYKTIAATEVYEGQLLDENPLTGNTYNWHGATSETIIGYVAMFRLLTGFEKELYMTRKEVGAHGQRYSQTFRNNMGTWVDNFDAMAKKTMIKQLLSKYGPLSIELQRAIEIDQGVIEGETVEYPDNTSEAEDKIMAANTKEQIEAVLKGLSVEDKKKLAPVASERLKEL